MKQTFWLWMICVGMGLSQNGFAADQLDATIKVVEVTPASGQSKSNSLLTWSPNGPTLWLVKDVSGTRVMTRLEGRLSPATASLTETSGKAKVELGAPGADSRPFKVTINQNAASVPLSLIVVGLKGQTTKREFKIEVDRYQETVTMGQQEKARRLAVSTWLSYSYNKLNQTGAVDVSQSSLTAKAALTLRFGNLYQPARWQLVGSGYITGLPFGVSPSSEYKMRFYGLDLKGMYLAHPSPDWTLGVGLGWYYATMTTSPIAFGYRDLSGPQLYLSAARKLGARWELGGYFKFSLINDQFAILALSNNELAGGLAATYAPWVGKPQRILLGVDYGHLNFNHESLDVSNTTAAFNIGYQF